MTLFKVAMEGPAVYLKAKVEGVLERRIAEIQDMSHPCELCPRRCKVNRAGKEVGFCKAPYTLVVSSAFPHFGEEAPLVGSRGSGTIFLSHCNLKCSFCQNYEISTHGEGMPCSPGRLADLMVTLQHRGCHNVNLVTPTHYLHQILKALPQAIEMGLTIPLVYNCGGYESVDVIRLLDGIVDIYMPDVKFFDTAFSKAYCNAEDYPEIVRDVVMEMQRQVGDLALDEHGIAKRGLLIRHLVMPGCTADTIRILEFIRNQVSSNAFVNVMDQYHPCYRAHEHRELSRGVTREEYGEAMDYARRIGLVRGLTR
jgi:putative pyruvate formate lyase activating enzyme